MLRVSAVNPSYDPPVQTLTDIKRILEEHGLRPKKSLGQNFLIDHNLLRRLVDSSGVSPGDLVLEIGPGTGTLTEELLERGCTVIGCELDDHLAEILRARLADQNNFTLIHADCLESKREFSRAVIEAIAGRPFRLVANLPYAAGTPAIMTLLIAHPECISMSVTIQREVADRITAKPGTRAYGAISVIAQSLARITKVANLPPRCFWPAPDVTSSMIHLERLAEPLTDDVPALVAFCERVFAKRRKQLGSVLGRDGPWPPGVLPEDRAESLDPPTLIALARIAPTR